MSLYAELPKKSSAIFLRRYNDTYELRAQCGRDIKGDNA